MKKDKIEFPSCLTDRERRDAKAFLLGSLVCVVAFAGFAVYVGDVRAFAAVCTGWLAGWAAVDWAAKMWRACRIMLAGHICRRVVKRIYP